MKWKKKQWNSWHWLEPSLESLQRIHVNDHVVNYPFDSFESYLVLHLIMVILDFTYVRIVPNLLMNILHSSQVPDSSVYFQQSSISSFNKLNFLLQFLVTCVFIGGFPIKIETQISLLISYSLAIFIVWK